MEELTMSHQPLSENKLPKPRKPEAEEPAKHPPDGAESSTIVSLQAQVGNRAVQRLLAQRSGDGPFELDGETEARINSERGGGQPLDSAVQAKMGDATGQDFNDVKVHTGPESHALNEQLGAKAFTTGPDIFFRGGAYDPGSSGGQELLTHELTHVVQQRSGSVGGGSGGMTVNAPGDAYEQEADAVSKSVMSGGAAPVANAQPGVQRQAEDEEEVQMQAQEDEEEAVQMQAEEEDETLQRQEMPEEEEVVQKQEAPEEEEEPPA